MDKKSKILLWVFFIFILASVSFSFYRYMIKRDYAISAETACDPVVQKCYVRDCEEEVDGTGCDTLAEGEKVYYYTIVERNYRNIDCQTGDLRCVEVLPCTEGEADCAEIVCEGEGCSEEIGGTAEGVPQDTGNEN